MLDKQSKTPVFFVLLAKCTFEEHVMVEGEGVMLFNTTFNNISAISRRSVLLMEETVVPGENQRSAASHRQTLSHNVVPSIPRHKRSSNSQLWW
jgi:hypothetical protein